MEFIITTNDNKNPINIINYIDHIPFLKEIFTLNNDFVKDRPQLNDLIFINCSFKIINIIINIIDIYINKDKYELINYINEFSLIEILDIIEAAEYLKIDFIIYLCCSYIAFLYKNMFIQIDFNIIDKDILSKFNYIKPEICMLSLAPSLAFLAPLNLKETPHLKNDFNLLFKDNRLNVKTINIILAYL